MLPSDITITRLETKLATLSWRRNQLLEDFISELDNIYDELRSCGAEVFDPRMKIALLRALRGRLAHIKHAFFSQPHFSYLATCDSLKGHIGLSESLEEPSVHFVKTGPTQKYQHFGKKFCNLCKKTGHSAENCFKAMTPAQLAEKERLWKCQVCFELGHFNGKCHSEDSSEESEEPRTLMVSISNPKKANKSVQTSWIIDSGCTNHMCSSAHFLRPRSITSFSAGRKDYLANGESSPITHEGYADLQLLLPGRKVKKAQLARVLVVPGLLKNLISVSALLDNGVDVHFDGRAKKCYLKDGTVPFGEATLQDGLWELSQQSYSPTSSSTVCYASAVSARSTPSDADKKDGQKTSVHYVSVHPMAAKLNFADKVVATCQAFIGPLHPVDKSRFTRAKKIVRPSEISTSTFAGNRSASSQGPRFFNC